uniref:Uncharacterized protein n=1 Tax=uncultured marine virus TaxID=186617 RepID=S4TFB3_9VIRU|nr:hypothetical protein [uncultured marine virus]
MPTWRLLMARKRSFSPTPRRKRVWADSQIVDTGFAESALRSNNLLSGFIAAGGATQGVTVQRTIIDLVWTINESHTFADDLTIGLIKGTTATADVADPVLEPYADWAFLKTTWSGNGHGLVAADAAMHVHVDTATMRKIDEVGETWWLIVKGTAPQTASATYDYYARVRTLLLLP